MQVTSRLAYPDFVSVMLRDCFLTTDLQTQSDENIAQLSKKTFFLYAKAFIFQYYDCILSGDGR